MFNVNSSSLSEVTSWDTNYARTYLQIPKDQLEKINKIPGWSKTSENDKALENTEKQLIQQTSISTESILATNTNSSSKANYNLKIQCHNSDWQSKQKSESEKVFLKKFSLSPFQENNNSSANLLKRSSSLPELHQELQSHNEPEFYRKRVHSFTFDCGINQDQHFRINSHKSCPLKLPSQLSKQKKLKTLGDRILNDKNFEGIKSGVVTCNAGTFSASQMSSFEKKLLLLEKRLSPSKEMSPPPFNAELMNVEKVICEKNLKSSQNLVSVDKVSTVTISSDLVEKLPDRIQNYSASGSHESFESQTDSQSLKEKKDAFDIDRTTGISKTTANNFESFLSPEIPCGQPVPTEVPSPPQTFQSEELAKLNTPSKFQNSNPLVLCGQALPVEVPSVNQPIPLQKLAKVNTPSKSQNLKLLDSVKTPEKTSGTFSVFSASSNEQVSDVVSNKELGTKRKRRNKSEKSSKKLDVKKIKRIDIQFSSAQIKNMLEIMKLFLTEV